MVNNYKLLFKKAMKYSSIGIFLQCVFFASVFAQGIVVTGKVTTPGDESGLPGVNIVIKGTSQGTTTDADGRYSIQVPDANATLIFSFIGYTTTEVAVGAQTVVDVELAT